MFKNTTKSHRQSHMQKQMIILGVVIFAIVIYLFVFGLNSVIGFSIWIGDSISGNKKTETKKTESFFGTLFVDDLQPATNSARIMISGNSSSYDTITFEINGKDVKTIEVGNNDSFLEEIGNLKPGKNTIEVIASSEKVKNEEKSQKSTVTYKDTKPKLSITEPGNDSKTDKESITFKGDTDPGVSVEVDGAPAVVNTAGHFEASVRLHEGENTIVITATDEAGNVETAEIKVKLER